MSPRRGPDPVIAAGLRTLAAAPTDTLAGVAMTRTGRPAGQAPTVVLVHGLGSARSTWAPVLADLAGRYHLVVVDLPGHGRSDPLADDEPAHPSALADRLHTALAQAQVHRPHLVGSSLGGWVGLELAADGALASLTGLAPAGLQLQPGRPNRWTWGRPGRWRREPPVAGGANHGRHGLQGIRVARRVKPPPRPRFPPAPSRADDRRLAP